MTPPVQPSPVPPENPDDGTDSGVRNPTIREARLIAEAQAQAAIHAALEKQRKAEDALAAVTAKSEEAKGTKRFIWGTVGLVVATVAVTVSTLAFGQSAIDGGVAPANRRLDKVEAKQEVFEAKLQSHALEQVRSNTMLENISRRLGTEVPPPAPKVSLPDGGSP